MKFEKITKLAQFTDFEYINVSEFHGMGLMGVALPIQVLKDRVKAFLEFLLAQLTVGIICGIMVNIWKKNGLTKRRFDMFAGAAVAMAACADLQGVSIQDDA